MIFLGYYKFIVIIVLVSYNNFNYVTLIRLRYGYPDYQS